MSSIIKSPFINYASQNKKIIRVSSDDPSIIHNKPREDIRKEKTISEIIKEEKQKAKLIADDIINQARLSAEHIIQEARARAVELEQEAYQKATEQGYQDGILSGQTEGTRLTNEAQAVLTGAQEERKQILSSIEPRMVKLLTRMTMNLTGYIVDREEIILNLIKRGMLEVETLDYITLHVSKEDIDYVNTHKEVLCANLSNQVSLEILRDDNLEANACIIETKSGNIDCSLSTRLDGLRADLELLANSLQA